MIKKTLLRMYLDSIRIQETKDEDLPNLSKALNQIGPNEPELPRFKQKKKKPARGGGRP